jgi:hypothetical protein
MNMDRRIFMSTEEGAGGGLTSESSHADKNTSNSSGRASSTEAPYLPFLIWVILPGLINRSGLLK